MSKHFVVLAWHNKLPTEIVGPIPSDVSALSIVEARQRQEQGCGVTWQTCEGSIVDALIASARLTHVEEEEAP